MCIGRPLSYVGPEAFRPFPEVWSVFRDTKLGNDKLPAVWRGVVA